MPARTHGGSRGDEHRTDERDAVLAWGRDNLRALPWRSTREPWEILVSEVMAQQTGVDRVVEKWHTFLRRWPEPTALAAARLGDVLEMWAGLGYPRRARDLHAAARHMVDHHGGRVPDTLPDLLALPGVGPYTARAVLAFALERDVAVVDTNVARVLARRAGRRLSPREVQAEADGLLPAGRSWEWNQTLMEIGATCCRPTPRCDGCPLRRGCRWAAGGREAPDPAAGSAAVSRRQSRFAGSDRQARGRLMAALVDGSLDTEAALAATEVADDRERARRIVDGLVHDGLARIDTDGLLHLP